MILLSPPDLTNSQLAARYLDALRRSADDPEAALAAVYLGEALDRRRGVRKPAPRAARRAPRHVPDGSND